MEYEAVIGLEIHAELLTASKIFCGCATAFGAPPNTQVCEVCLGMPGSLPVLNRKALEYALKMALATGCRINPESVFARKNYFYPDLPKGYQISQFDVPLGEHGCVKVYSGDRTDKGQILNRREKAFRITRLHMEEDAGKSIHEGLPDTDAKSYVNLNRSGIPLVEIVSEPDFRSSQEAYDYLIHLRKTLLYLGVCDGNMEEGSLRCDANVSVRAEGSQEFGTKVEIKNLNSFRFLQKALDYEIERQKRVLSEGGRVIQETRLWDEGRSSTFAMRSKEEAHDYRYFPEPDLPPLKLDPAWIEEQKATLPELPHERMTHFMAAYQLPADDSLLLTSTRELADYFEESAKFSGNPRSSANWIMGDLTYALKNTGREIEDCPVTPRQLASLIQKIDSGEISGRIAKTVFEEMYRSAEEPDVVIKRLGLVQVSNEADLGVILDRILSANPKQVADYRAGKEKIFAFFVGLVMKETRGQANPQILKDLLLKKLKE